MHEQSEYSSLSKPLLEKEKTKKKAAVSFKTNRSNSHSIFEVLLIIPSHACGALAFSPAIAPLIKFLQYYNLTFNNKICAWRHSRQGIVNLMTRRDPRTQIL